MTPIDTYNYLDGQLRLSTFHYGSRTETILMHVPTMRQFTVRPGSEGLVDELLTEADKAGSDAPAAFDFYSKLEVEHGRAHA